MARTATSAPTTLTYCVADGPFGALPVVVSARGVYQIGLAPDPGLPEALRSHGHTVHDGGAEAREVARQLGEYFAGDRRDFDVEIDWWAGSPFTIEVRRCLAAQVGYGETISYGELAAVAGRPGAARAAGAAMANNPVPIVVPCHRVLNAAGKLHGYGGGLALKAALLRLEGVVVAEEVPPLRLWDERDDTEA